MAVLRYNVVRAINGGVAFPSLEAGLDMLGFTVHLARQIKCGVAGAYLASRMCDRSHDSRLTETSYDDSLIPASGLFPDVVSNCTHSNVTT